MTRTILITGASTGIGWDAAQRLAPNWRVFATYRRDSDAARLRDIGCIPIPMEMSDSASIKAGFAQVMSQTDQLDALFNNAAFACPGAVEDLPTDAIRAVFETNLFGLHDLTRLAIPVMRAQGGGRIVNNSSVLGYVAAPWRGAYVASKFALEGLTDALRLEMADTPIHIVLLEPGPITSQFRKNAIPHFERWIDWRASPRRAQYESTLMKRLYDGGSDRFELPATAVTDRLVQALDAPRPRARYRITTPARLAWYLRFLPARRLDALLSQS